MAPPSARRVNHDRRALQLCVSRQHKQDCPAASGDLRGAPHRLFAPVLKEGLDDHDVPVHLAGDSAMDQ
jgi:hypothetical protein